MLNYTKNDVLVLYEKWNETQQKFDRETTIKYHTESLRNHWRSESADTLENIERILKWWQQSEYLDPQPQSCNEAILSKLEKWAHAEQEVLSQIENGETQESAENSWIFLMLIYVIY